MVPELVAPGLGHQVLGKKEDQGMEEEGMGRRAGQREAAASRLFAAIQKNKGNWVIVPLIHLITGQSSSLAC